MSCSAVRGELAAPQKPKHSKYLLSLRGNLTRFGGGVVSVCCWTTRNHSSSSYVSADDDFVPLLAGVSATLFTKHSARRGLFCIIIYDQQKCRTI